MITFSERSFAHILPRLIQMWPEEGFRSERSAKRILATIIDKTERGRIHLDTATPRIELRTNGIRIATLYSTPWKYQKFFQKDTNVNYSAIKIRPGAVIPLRIGGAETTAYVNGARRITFRGSPNYLKLDINLNTENLPIWVERESKLTCKYCGTEPRGDEVSCRSCGANLPG